MVYTKTNWILGKPPAINATNLNKIEQGIYDLSVSLEQDVFLLDQTTPQTVVNGIPLLDKTFADFTSIQEIVNKDYVDMAVASLGARYYMIDTSSGIADYKLTQLSPPSGSEQSVTKTGLVDDEYIAGWISPDTSLNKLIKGVYNWYIYAEKTGGTQTLRLYWQLVERKSDTTETVIATSAVSNEISTSKGSYIIPLTLSEDYTLADGSYVVGKLYADVSDGGSAPDVAIYYDGSSKSHWEIPTNLEIFSDQFLKLDGSNANSDIDITPYNLTVNNISAFNLKSTASYIIWTDGSTIYALNGSTGEIDYSGTDADTIYQSVLNDLNSVGGGKVILKDGTFNIGTEPTYYDNIMIEGQGKNTTIKLTSDVIPFNFHNISNTHVRDLSIEVSDGHTEALLQLYADGTGTVRYCSFDNISVINPYSAHDYTVIRLKMADDRSILENYFKEINSDYCDRLIHILGLSDACWANANRFEKIWAGGYKTAIVEFEPTATAIDLANRNTFIDVKAQTKSDSLDGFKNIYSTGNVFINCLAWDWVAATSPNYAWSLNSGAKNNIIISPDDSNSLQDNSPIGYKNFIILGDSLGVKSDIDIEGRVLINNYLLIKDYAGIGTLTPTYTLDVSGNARISGTIADIIFDGSGARLNFTRDNTSYIAASDANGRLSFGAGGADDMLVIDKSGNVGIRKSIPNSALQINGSLAVKVTEKAEDYTTSGETIIGITDTSVERTITLASADCVAGRLITIKDESGGAGTHSITIATQGSETIDGASTATINTNYGCIRLYSNGNNWFTI